MEHQKLWIRWRRISACWPNLRPYNKRKLAFWSTRCVFLGYSSHHKGVKCLDPSTGRFYISRDVVFDESIFPFASLNPHTGKHLQKDILLFPTHTSSISRDAHIDDYMPLPVVPNVTNVHDSDISHTAIQVDVHQNTEHDNPEPPSGSETDANSLLPRRIRLILTLRQSLPALTPRWIRQDHPCHRRPPCRLT
jgi:histone deacetylase 1/2